MSRIFLQNGTPLTVTVEDTNGRNIQADSPNAWGHGPELALSEMEVSWLAELHADTGDPCAQLDASDVSRAELVTAGGGDRLLPAQVHVGVVKADGRDLYRFEFSTSRYASFRHHLANFSG